MHVSEGVALRASGPTEREGSLTCAYLRTDRTRRAGLGFCVSLGCVRARCDIPKSRMLLGLHGEALVQEEVGPCRIGD